MNNATLVLENFCVSIQEKKIFLPVNVVIQPGHIASVMGPSGSGKSTLLAAISGTLDTKIFTVHGNVLLAEKSVLTLPAHKRNIGVMFQDALLFPHMNIAENLAFAIPAGTPKTQRKEIVRLALQQVELENLHDRRTFEVSGGQQMRVALMRTLIAKPRVVLLDEPFSKLDEDLRTRLRESIFTHIRARYIPALMVTHDQRDAMATNGDPIIQLVSAH